MHSSAFQRMLFLSVITKPQSIIISYDISSAAATLNEMINYYFIK